MNTAAILGRWREAARHIDPGSEMGLDQHDWDESPHPMLLHAFRPAGERLEALIDCLPEPVDGADEVLARLRAIYAASDADPARMYLVPDVDQPATPAALRPHAEAYLAQMAQVLDQLEAWDSAQWEDGDPAVAAVRAGRLTVVAEPAVESDPALESDLITLLYEASNDYGAARLDDHPLASLLREPAYQLACSHDLAHHALWPWRGPTGEDEPDLDPFTPALALWRAGAELAGAADGLRVHAGGLTLG